MARREIIGRLVEGILSIITLLASFILMCAGKEGRPHAAASVEATSE